MPAPVREDIWAALKAQLSTMVATPPVGLGQVTAISRVWVPWSDLPGTNVKQPVIFIVQTKNRYTEDKGNPPIRKLTCDLVVYANRGSELTDETAGVSQLDGILDAIDVALKPDPITGVNTLGGLVSHCWIEGEVLIYEGTLGEQMQAIVPVEILLNQDNTSPPKHYIFDTGDLFITPVTQKDGQPANISASVRFANLKGVTIESRGKLIVSPSQLRHAIRMAKGAVDITVKARFGTFDGVLMDQAFFEQNRQTGATRFQRDEAQTVSGVGSVFAAVPPGGTYMTDLGVYYKSTGQPFQKVAFPGPLAAGQYQLVAPGSYQFNSADNAAPVALNYLYSVLTGTKIVMANLFKGLAPTFQAVLSGRYNDQQTTWVLEACASERFNMPTLLEQFTIVDFEFQAFADLNGNIGTISAG